MLFLIPSHSWDSMRSTIACLYDPFCSAVGWNPSMKCNVIPSLFLALLILKTRLHDTKHKLARQIRANRQLELSPSELCCQAPI